MPFSSSSAVSRPYCCTFPVSYNLPLSSSNTAARRTQTECPCVCQTQAKLGKAALREKKELYAKWGEILLAAKVERADLEARCAALRGRGAVLRERRRQLQDEVDSSRARLFTAKAGDRRWV